MNLPPIRRSSTWSDLFAALFALVMAVGGFTLMIGLVFGSRPNGGIDRKQADMDRAQQTAIGQAAAAETAWQKKLADNLAAEKAQAVKAIGSEPYFRPGDIPQLPPKK